MSPIVADMNSYSLADLEADTGVTQRVIRDYIARGYLPAPAGKGRAARYNDTHLNRIKCLQVLRNATPRAFTLDMLGSVLNSLTEDRIKDIAEGREEVQAMTLGKAPSEPMPAAQLREALAGSKPEQTALGRLARELQPLVGKEQPYKSDTEHWISVSITPDIEFRARNLGATDIGQLERVANQLRQLLIRS